MKIDLSSPEERGKRLKTLLGMTSMSRKEFGEKYGIGQTTLNYWEYARQGGITEKGAKKIISAVAQEGIEVTVAWLMFGIDSLPQFKQLNTKQDYFSEYSSDTLLSVSDSITEEIDLFKKNNKDSVVMSIIDNGMNPLFKPGDIVGGIIFNGANLIEAIDMDCIISISEDKLICRRLIKSNGTDLFNLSCINNSTEILMPVIYNTAINFAAPITRLWRTHKR